MKSAIEKILAAHQLLDAFNSNEDYYVKIENPPFMPLSIEKQGPMRVIVAHYAEQNGDLIPDPDMSFEVAGELWLPIAIQHSTGHYYQASEYRDGKVFVDHKQRRDQQRFARMWGANLLAQGFDRGKVARIRVG